MVRGLSQECLEEKLLKSSEEMITPVPFTVKKRKQLKMIIRDFPLKAYKDNIYRVTQQSGQNEIQRF